jgi:hypothetical protein
MTALVPVCHHGITTVVFDLYPDEHMHGTIKQFAWHLFMQQFLPSRVSLQGNHPVLKPASAIGCTQGTWYGFAPPTFREVCI